MIDTRPLYAARLNAFRHGLPGKPGIRDLIARAGTVPGLDAADLNFPDHFAGESPKTLSAMLTDAGLALNGVAMRYYTDPGFRLGAFTNPDRALRQRAIDMTKEGLDALGEMGQGVMTLWMGQDGVDYSFQADHARMWDDTLAALDEICAHTPAQPIAIEYKPNEPRAYALMPDAATTLLAVREVGRDNLGVALDFCHVLFADEVPAHAAALIARHSRLLGVHLNDGYGKRDDGLMVGSVHPVQTVELFLELDRQGYDGAIYFDTFPDHGGLDPVAESAANVAMAERLRAAAGRLRGDAALAGAIARQDAAAALHIVAAALYR